ncbi:MAG: NTP transferase domain-containing protein [Saprospiraceae bacterium]|nr:NTP transferase domain-containing protein [Saprospiraceae bacterium]
MKAVDTIILAGGMGTRLKSVISEIPKPMAPIGDTPFLQFLIRSLQRQSISHITLSTGFKGEVIEEYFGSGDEKLHIDYYKEDQPLGTGGAIKAAMALTSTEEVLILNGDTFFNININALIEQHQAQDADITIAMRQVSDEDRYGAMIIDNKGRVQSFAEKAYIDSGYINGGIYLIKRDLFDRYDLPEKFSLENDLFSKYVDELRIYGIPFNDYFIDIGIPEDYERAFNELPEIVKLY